LPAALPHGLVQACRLWRPVTASLPLTTVIRISRARSLRRKASPSPISSWTPPRFPPVSTWCRGAASTSSLLWTRSGVRIAAMLFTVTGLPQGVTATVDPNPVTPGANPVTVTVTLTGLGLAFQMQNRARNRAPLLRALLVPLIGLRLRARRTFWRALFLAPGRRPCGARDHARAQRLFRHGVLQPAARDLHSNCHRYKRRSAAREHNPPDRGVTRMRIQCAVALGTAFHPDRRAGPRDDRPSHRANGVVGIPSGSKAPC